jgi:hypothetical protein
MTETHPIQDRAAALGNALHELRRECAVAGDVQNLVPIKEADRTLKNAFGRSELPGDPYSDLKERLIDQAYAEDVAEEQVIVQRIDSLTEGVRRECEAELAGEREQLLAAAAESAKDLEDREAIVTAREKKAKPSYRATFAIAGALLAVAGDLLLRVVV